MFNRRLQGFTLIELLVVIAIIALLAAILFPVFAQAREKARQTSCLSNNRQVATAILQYVQDYDETYPLATYSIAGMNGFPGLHGFGSFLLASPPELQYPATATHTLATAVRSVYPTTLKTYLKNTQVFACPSAETGRFDIIYAGTIPVGVTPEPISIFYSGYLTQATTGMIRSPTTVPMLWEGFGKSSNAFFQPQPSMECPNGNATCIYQPTTAGCALGNGGKGYLFGTGFVRDMRVHSGGQNIAYADGHVKWLKMGASAGSGTDEPFGKDPYRRYDSKGIPSADHKDANGCHVEFFRLEKE